ncbi:PucR family transcriptional regulator [Streptomyces sp. NPDC087440]|uniref:PucR family transcriptional regulator n=1 Tax=Streptomyces sp. NPDC087440 TaxID=3365790 RepID=UPI0038184728
MLNRPCPSLRRIVDDLGSTVLHVVAAPPGDLRAGITGVHIYDPLDELLVTPGTLLLAVGVEGGERIRALMRAAAPAAALIVKQPVEPDEPMRQTAAETGVAVLGLARAASWAQIAAMLRSLLSEGDFGDPEDGLPGDLFVLANAICALLDAPVTIEDRDSRILAHSGRQEEADPSRVATVLARQVPDHIRRIVRERGILQQLDRSREPVFVRLEEGDIRRTAIAVRSGDEILGSIWVAAPDPLDAQRASALTDAAKIVALQLLRERAGADTRRRLRADLLSTVLEGGPGAPGAAARLGMADGAPGGVCVLAAQLADDTAVHTDADRERFCDALALHVSAIHPRSSAAVVGTVAYAVLPMPQGRADHEGSERRAVEVARKFLSRTGVRYAARIGVGRPAATLAQVARSRADADRALRVLTSHQEPHTAAGYTELHIESLLLQLGDLATVQEHQPVGAYRHLLAYDSEHGSDLVATLSSYLDALGDVPAASARMHVHPNTFRYRLKRVVEVSGLDLDDPQERLGVMLQIRLFGASAAAGAPAPKRAGGPPSP